MDVAIDTRADDELDPYQMRLYVRITRVCSEAEDGACHDSTQELAAACKMSAGAVVKAKRGLVELGFIKIEAGKGKRADAISSMSLHEQETASVSSGEHESASVHPSVSHGEQENPSMSPDERYELVYHTVNTTPLADARAVTSSLSLLSTKDKDLKAKDKNNNTPLTPQTQNGGGVDSNLPRVAELYEQVTSRTINPLIADELKDDAKTYSLERIEEAARLTLLSGKTTWRYVQGILKNADGGNSKPRASPPAPVEKRTRDSALAGFDANQMLREMAAAGTTNPGWNPFEEEHDAQKPATANS